MTVKTGQDSSVHLYILLVGPDGVTQLLGTFLRHINGSSRSVMVTRSWTTRLPCMIMALRHGTGKNLRLSIRWKDSKALGIKEMNLSNTDDRVWLLLRLRQDPRRR